MPVLHRVAPPASQHTTCGLPWRAVNLVDLLLLLVLLFASVRGFRQGALSQVAAFGGAIFGLLLGAAFAPRLASIFVEQPGVKLAVVTLVLLLAFVLLGQGLGYTIGLRLRQGVHRLGAGNLDKAAGIGVGIASLLLAVWLVGGALAQGPVPVIAQQVQGSRLLRVLAGALPPPPDLFGRVAAYLDSQGFPQVFAGLGGGPTAPPVDPPSGAAVEAATVAGGPSTVQVEALGCGGISSGSGFVTVPGFVVTNAHVVAGGEVLTVRDSSGTHPAITVLFDPVLDLALVSSPESTAPPIAWTATPADRGVAGATLGFPGGQRQLNVRPAAVRSRSEALGRDIYGGGLTTREILTLSAGVEQGDSGGPFVTQAGQVAGVVFAAAAAEPGVGYALTAEQVRPAIDAAIAANTAVAAGSCRV